MPEFSHEHVEGKGIILILFTMLIIVASVSPVTGGIRKADPQFVIYTSPPADLRPEAKASDDEIVIFQEKYAFKLPNDIAVDITANNTYDAATPLTPGIVSAGTMVNSYYIHADQVGEALIEFRGTVKFEEPILGIIIDDDNLDISDGDLGHTGVIYPYDESMRGLKTYRGEDIITLRNIREIEVHLPLYGVTDQMRVITAAMDHFHGYKLADPLGFDDYVALSGQFDEGTFLPTHLLDLVAFANPVAKDGGEINKQTAHYTFYKIDAPDEFDQYTVDIENQFESTTFQLGEPKLMMAPAAKGADEESRIPISVDHCKCYKVSNSAPVGATVHLSDQWHDDLENVQIGRAVLFCIPVRKRHEGEVYRPRHREDHFTIYKITNGNVGWDAVVVKDQFGLKEIIPQVNDFLVVPTKKISWEKLE